MDTIALVLSKYILAILMAVYTFQCFSVFRFRDEKERNGIYVRQDIAMSLIYFISFMILYLKNKDTDMLKFYALTQLILLTLILLYRYMYPEASKLLVNNMCLLMSIGFIIITRLNFGKAKKQFIVALISIGMAVVIPYILKKFKRLRRFYILLAVAGIAALATVLVFSAAVNGSKLNIKIGGVSFQASEFVKIIFVFSIAGMLTCMRSKYRVLIATFAAGVHVLLLVASKDLGSAIIFFIVYVVMIYVSSGNLAYLLAGLSGAAISSVIGYQMFSHVRVRVEAWKDPIGNIDNSGYQIAQSLFAMGTGGFSGMGLTQGAPERIPVVEADFIFAAISEEFGVFFGICLILVCVSCFVMFMNIAMRFNDMFYKLVAVGLAVTYGFQVFLTIGGVSKFIPLTGVTLPLVSYGSNSIMVSLIMFSVIQGLYVSVRTSENTAPDSSNKAVLKITYIFSALFVALIGYIAYFTAFTSDSFINNTYNNKRADLLSQKTVRGSIVSKDGKVLADTEADENGNEIRKYPYGNIFAHAVGFYSKDNGTIGVESVTNFKLLTSNDIITNRLKNDLYAIKNEGDTVITTFDTKLQETAYNALGDKKGAVVVMDVKTGEILALVSKPDFDPNTINDKWEMLNEDTENSPLLNRVSQGLYPPGSTFKIVTALEYIKENDDLTEYEFDCSGSFEYEDVRINCYHGQPHGKLDLDLSFAKSCNSSFANISSKLDKESFAMTCDKLMFNKEIPSPFSYKQSSIDISGHSDAADVIQAGIGQGKTSVTPIHMAMITSAIANDGVLMKPMAVSAIKNRSGGTVKRYDAQEYGRLMRPEETAKLKKLMREVVETGTGSRLKNTIGYEAAGKTGSAEFSENKTKSHAWFTGFAPLDKPRIAVTVIVEEGGSGGETAVPIARSVFDEYFRK